MRVWVLAALLSLSLGCASAPTESPRLESIYGGEIRDHGPTINPVVVIPGLLGSTLRHRSGTGVWGAFRGDYADPTTPEGARLFALPFARREDQPYLPSDEVQPLEVLHALEFDLLGIPFKLNAYVNVLKTLALGGYRDEQLGQAGSVDYGDLHYTCFQFAYDWRRSNVWNAKKLHAFLLETKRYVEAENARRYGYTAPVKFDLVAHSMGGLLARYYLRYGDADLAEGIPVPTWKGAELVERAVLVGTPNAGATSALIEMVEGVELAFFLPAYSPGLVGTFESGYELLPRTRHARLLNAAGQPVGDLYDPELWEEQGWGLLDPDEAETLAVLLPEVEDPAERREVARRHLRRALRNARRFHLALDVPAAPPPGLELFLFAGDAKQTADQVQLGEGGALRRLTTAPGDGTVTRKSALLDERVGHAAEAGPLRSRRLISPISWRQVHFVFSDHLGMTGDASFGDNLLFLLLDDQRVGLPEEAAADAPAAAEPAEPAPAGD